MTKMAIERIIKNAFIMVAAHRRLERRKNIFVQLLNWDLHTEKCKLLSENNENKKISFSKEKFVSQQLDLLLKH